MYGILRQTTGNKDYVEADLMGGAKQVGMPCVKVGNAVYFRVSLESLNLFGKHVVQQDIALSCESAWKACKANNARGRAPSNPASTNTVNSRRSQKHTTYHRNTHPAPLPHVVQHRPPNPVHVSSGGAPYGRQMSGGWGQGRQGGDNRWDGSLGAIHHQHNHTGRQEPQAGSGRQSVHQSGVSNPQMGHPSAPRRNYGQQNKWNHNQSRHNQAHNVVSSDSRRLERMERRQVQFQKETKMALLGMSTLLALTSDHIGVKADPECESYYGYSKGDPIFGGRRMNPRNDRGCEVFKRPTCRAGATCPVWDSPLGCWFFHPGGWKYSVFYNLPIFIVVMGGGAPCVRYHTGVGGTLCTHPVSVAWVRAQWCPRPLDTFRDTWCSRHCMDPLHGR